MWLAEEEDVGLFSWACDVLLAVLLRRARWPLGPDVFRALVGMSVSVPIELAVLDGWGNVLLFRREDEEYAGSALPGTVLRDNERVADALARLRACEVGARVTSPTDLGWVEVARGNGPSENPTRHELSLLHACQLVGSYTGKDGKFFPTDALPADTLSHHRVLIDEIMARLEARQKGVAID